MNEDEGMSSTKVRSERDFVGSNPWSTNVLLGKLVMLVNRLIDDYT